MPTPKFSFIMPVFNDGKTVERAVESILDQDMKSVEIILINDGSTDDTKMRIGYLATMHPEQVKVINFEKNQGACVARNEGAKVAKGEYFAWLPADAKLYPGALRIWMDALDENKDKAFVYGGYRVTDEDYNHINGGDFFFEPFNAYQLETSNYIDGSFPIRASEYWRIAKEIGKDGLWDKEVISLQDWDFWLTVVKHGGIGIYIRDIFFETTMPHPGGLSDDSNRHWIERTKFIQRKQEIPERKVCVCSLGAGWHARNIAKMLNADFKDMPSFKPHEYDCLYLIGFYPEFATQQDQMFWNNLYDQKQGRTPAKKVVHFVGSDVWQLYHVSTMSLKIWRDYFKKNVDVLLCEADFVKRELEELGIENVRSVIIPPTRLYDVMPLPEKFTVAVYQPHVNADFYFPAEMEAIAAACPEIDFKFFGNPARVGVRKSEDGKTDLNIEDVGYIDNERMGEFIGKCSAIMRFPKHDGMPLSVLEFLTAGRYSLQSVPVSHSYVLPISQFSVEAASQALKSMKEVIKEPNVAGSEFWKKEASHEKYIETMKEILKYNPKEYWENRAESWVSQAATQPVETEQVKEMFMEAKKQAQTESPSVLDIGCGDGRWYKNLKEWGMNEYRGIDISEKLIDAAKQRFPEIKAAFKASSVEAMTPEDWNVQNFDVIFSYTCLEHITEEDFPKAVEALKKMGKWLLLVEPTDFKSRHYCHTHDYAKYFTVVKETALADKKILLCKLN